MDIKRLQKKYDISEADLTRFRYEPEILGMLELPGFYARYCKMLSQYETNKEAYEATERQFNSYFAEKV